MGAKKGRHPKGPLVLHIRIGWDQGPFGPGRAKTNGSKYIFSVGKG